ncbi:hypothetical protein GCM10009557_05730 [Virgisporangium ochraceum]|uniref:Uncharacterized protein n=1 Tax=Virgisporangium ochraceum TaxID=65505 RepID=A0A8J3ZRK3_9ACTN|nr:hypothetical protein [Virgisporangium ochraceum]GIJ66230.1 hypothetical protein Voc01_011470 [Virgisporangium ochraceum]
MSNYTAWDYDLRVVQLNDAHYRLFPDGADASYWQLHHNGAHWNVFDDAGQFRQELSGHDERDLGFAAVLGEPQVPAYDDNQAHLLTHAAAMGGWLGATYCELEDLAEATAQLVYWGRLVYQQDGNFSRYRLTVKGQHEAARLAG